MLAASTSTGVGAPHAKVPKPAATIAPAASNLTTRLVTSVLMPILLMLAVNPVPPGLRAKGSGLFFCPQPLALSPNGCTAKTAPMLACTHPIGDVL